MCLLAKAVARLSALIPSFRNYFAVERRVLLSRIHLTSATPSRTKARNSMIIPRPIHSTPIQSKSSMLARVSAGILLIS
jgi:hypothetical protein